MAAEPSLLTIDSTALQETVGQMCAGYDRLEAFLRGLFGDLDSLTDEMMQHGRRVDSTKLEQETHWSEHEALLGREREELETTFQRIQTLTDQLGASAGTESGGSEQFREALSGIDEERSALRTALAASESQSADLARMADELAAARQDVAATREELCSQRELLSQAPAEGDPSAIQAALAASKSQGAELTRMADELTAARQDVAATREELCSQRELFSQVPAQSGYAADPEIHDRLEQLEQKQLVWTQERAVLETELDTVRTRAAELADTLEDERQRATGERKDWAEELRQMRQLLQSFSDRTDNPVSVPAVAAPLPPAPELPERDDSQDPVLDSVMAQFEILQKDLARRRKAKPASK